MSRGTTPLTHILALGGEQVRVLEWPGEAPTLVAWPGLGGTAEYFGMLADSIPFRMVALDPPGVGAVSTGLPDRDTVDRVWGDAIRWAAGVGGPVVVMGHSWGGYLARLALGQPELPVAGAVLLDGGYVPWVDPKRALAEEIAQGRDFMAQAVTQDADEAVAIEQKRLEATGVDVTPAVVAALRSGYVRQDDGRFRLAVHPAAFEAAMQSLADVPVENYLDTAGPTLLFAAVGMDGVPGRDEDFHAQQQRMLERFRRGPAVRLVVLPGVSHEVLPEAQAIVGSAITAWLGDSRFRCR